MCVSVRPCTTLPAAWSSSTARFETIILNLIVFVVTFLVVADTPAKTTASNVYNIYAEQVDMRTQS